MLNLDSLLKEVKDRRAWKKYLFEFFPIVHPSPRNEIWLAKNRWFEKSVVPELERIIHEAKK